MPSKIRVLNDHTINQIAAGEVIENPASVVKELVENSIDSGASEISVEIKGGGRQLIRITDNGCGMNNDDALLCLERHATSKIKEVADIHTIATMGFRGEAVPSIASISKFTILTCAEGETQGTLVVVDGGKILRCSPAARSVGTTIEVNSLFFNVPVRKKFQKSPQIDTNEILKILSTLALGHPHIKFELISNQESILSAPIPKGENKLEERIRQVLGSDFAASLSPIEGKRGELELKGFIGLPAFTKQNRTGQYLFINQRHVVNSFVSFAIREGYGTTLAPNRHPIYVLQLSIPGDLVDVNVHPQKREVRLRQEEDLKQLTIGLVESALQHAGFSYSNDFVVLPPVSFNEPPAYKPYVSFEPLKEEFPAPAKMAVKQPEPFLFTKQESTLRPRVMATLFNYILIDPQTLPSKEAVLCLADQRAVHARIIFEKLTEEQQISSQPLLIPHTLATTPLEAAAVHTQLDFLNSIGIHIHQSGPQSFIIDAIPDFFSGIDLHLLITTLVHEYSAVSEREKALATAANRLTILRNKKLGIDEAQVLINRLFQCKTPYYCPQGRPTLIHVPAHELEKFFKG